MKKTMLFKALSLAVALLMPWQMISWASPEVTSALRQLPALDRGLPLPGDAGRTGNVVRHTGGGGRSRAGSPNRQYYRQLVAPEFLGKRDLLSVTSMVGFDYSHQPTDINGDHNTTPVDALIVINALNAAGIQPVVSTTTGHPGSEYLDPTDDQVVSPIDALSIVNALNNVDEVFTQMGANGAPVNVHRTGQDQVTITVSTPDGRTAAELTPPIALLPGRVADDVKFTWADGTHALVTINNGMNQAQSAGAFLINTDAGTIATLINPVLAAGATDNFWGENGPQAWVTSNQGKDQVVVANNGTANSGPFMTQPFITVWNAQTGAVVRQTPLSSSVSAAAFDAQRNAVMLTCPDPTAPGGATTQIKALMPDGSIRDSEVTDTSFTQHANNGNAVNVRFDQGHVVISAVDANGQQRASFTPAEVYVSSRFDTPYNLTNTIWSPDGNSAVVLIDNRMNLYQGTEVVYVDCVAGTVKELVSSKMVAGTEDNLWTANGPQVWLANGQIIAANTGYIPTDGTYAFWLVRPGISVWDAQTGALLKQTKLPMSVNDARLDAATNTVTVTYADAKAPNGVREQDWTVMADGSVKEKTGIEVTRTLDAGGTTATFAMPSIKRTATITVKDNTTVTLTIRTNKGAVLASHDLSTDVLTASKALQHAQFLTEPSGTWGLLVLPTYPTESSKASVTTFNLKSGAIMATLTPPASHEGDMSANRVQGNVAITGTGFAIETNFSRAFKATGLGNGTSYVTAYAPDGTVKSSLVVSKEFGSTVSVAGVGLGLRYSDMAYNGQGETFTTYYNVDASGNIWVSDNNDKTYSAAAMSALAAAPFTKSQMMMSFAGRATNPDGSGLVAIRYRDTATNALETWLVPFGKDGAINKAGITQSTESTPVIKNIDASGNETFTMPTLSRTATASAHDATTIAFTVFDGTGTALAAPTLLSTDVIAARDGIASMQVLPNADGKWAVVEYKDYPEGGVAEVVTVDLATGKKMADINPPSSNEGDFSADRVYGSVVIVNGSIETANYGKAFKATGLGNGTSYVMAYAPDGTVKSSVTVSKEFGSTTYVTGKGLGLVYSDMAYNGQGETFITYYGVDAAGNVSVTDNKDRELSTKAADALAAAPFTKASMMVSFAGRTENADGTSVVAMKWKNAATNTIETWLVPFDKNGAVVTGAITQTPESIPVITTFDAAGNATFAMPTLGHTATATAKDTTTIALTLRDANGTALAAPILLNTDVITAADSIKGMRFLPANGAWGAVVYQDYPKGQIAEVITVDLNAGTKIADINPPASYQGDMSADRVYGNVWIINGDVVTVNFGQQPFTASGAGRGQTYMTVYTAQGAVVTSLLLTESFDSANYVQSKGINLPHSDVAWNGRPETFNVWRSIDASGAISVTDNKDREFATKAEVALNAAPYNKPMMPMSYAGRYQYSNGVSIVALNWLDTTTHTFETWLVPIGADGNAVASSISKATENDPVIKGYNTDGSALFVMPTLGSSAIAAPVATATRKVSITVFNANGDALATPIILDTGVISPADAIASMQILPNADGSWAVVEYSTYPKGAIADVITLDLHTGQQIAEINPPAAHQGDMSADRVYGNVWIINGNVVTVNYGWQPFTASGAGRGPSYITVYDVHGAVVNSLQPTYSFNSASYTPGKGVDIPRGVGAWNGQYETYNTWYGIDASGAISIVDTKDSQLAAKAETALNAAPYNKSTMPMSFAGRKENADGTSIVTLNWLNTTTHLLETWQVTFGTDDNVAPNGIRQISSTSSATFTFVTDLWSRGSWNNDERPITIGVANTTNGIAPVAGVDIVIGASADAGSAAASFHYDANAGTWFVGDADNEWTGGLSSSTAGTLTGVHGSLDLARTTVARTYSTMTLALQASLFAMSGRQGVFVSTTDQAGLATAFTRIGNWDVSSDAMPHLEQVTVPAVSIAGTAQTFTATCSDSNGTADIASVTFQVTSLKTGIEGFPATNITYSAVENRLYLRSDDGLTQLGGFAPGTAQPISNSSVTVNVADTRVESTDAGLTVTLSVTPAAAIAGQNKVQVVARDVSGNVPSDQYDVSPSPWMVAAQTPGVTVTELSQTKTVYSNAPVTLMTRADANGTTDHVGTESIVIMNPTDQYKTVTIRLDTATNLITVQDGSTGSWSRGYATGSANVIQTDSLDVNCANTTWTGADGTPQSLFFAPSVIFHPVSAGVREVYSVATSKDSGQSSGLVHQGQLIVSADNAPSVKVAQLSTGSVAVGQTTTIQVQVEDKDGYQDVKQLEVLVGKRPGDFAIGQQMQTPVYVRMICDAQANTITLYADDNTTVIGQGTIGSNVILANSLISINLANTILPVAGMGRTLNLPVIFNNPLMGTANRLYVGVTDIVGATTGVNPVGTVSITPVLAGTGTLSGTVVDATGNLLPFVTVIAHPSNYGYGTHDCVTTTTAQGTFTINGMTENTSSSGGTMTWVTYTVSLAPSNTAPSTPVSAPVTFHDAQAITMNLVMPVTAGEGEASHGFDSANPATLGLAQALMTADRIAGSRVAEAARSASATDPFAAAADHLAATNLSDSSLAAGAMIGDGLVDILAHGILDAQLNPLPANSSI